MSALTASTGNSVRRLLSRLRELRVSRTEASARESNFWTMLRSRFRAVSEDRPDSVDGSNSLVEWNRLKN